MVFSPFDFLLVRAPCGFWHALRGIPNGKCTASVPSGEFWTGFVRVLVQPMRCSSLLPYLCNGSRVGFRIGRSPLQGRTMKLTYHAFSSPLTAFGAPSGEFQMESVRPAFPQGNSGRVLSESWYSRCGVPTCSHILVMGHVWDSALVGLHSRDVL